MSPVSCTFCDPLEGVILFRSPLWYARSDLHPVSPGHLLLIPFRHLPSFFDLSPEEWAAFGPFTLQAKEHLDPIVASDGYNLGVNIGRRGSVHLTLECADTQPLFKPCLVLSNLALNDIHKIVKGCV